MRQARPLLAALLAPAVAPEIALRALVRLRWLAVVGQIAATTAAAVLGVHLLLGEIALVIAITFLTNVALAVWTRHRRPRWLVQAALLLDILLLTALLYLTGGPENPFAPLYLVNLTISVIFLGPGWTWILVAVVAACYALLAVYHLPLAHTAPPWAMAAGRWFGLVLVGILIAGYVGRMIRELRRRDLELAEAHQRAARNEHLAALTTLATGAAHELGTPLGTIAVVAHELDQGCDRPGTDPSIREDARLIRQEVDRCRAILNRMRVDLAEDTSQQVPIRVAELLERLRASLTPEQASLLAVECGDLEQLLGPPRTLEQSLLVLLRNAFDASPPGRPVTLRLAAQGRDVRFEVCDQGTGMTPDQLRRVGQPFFTTKEPGQGMGLGLFLVRLVAERLGADFRLQSEQGQGTCAILVLPGAAYAHGDH